MVPYAKLQETGAGGRAIGACPGPEFGENTSHLEKNVTELEKKIKSWPAHVGESGRWARLQVLQNSVNVHVHISEVMCEYW